MPMTDIEFDKLWAWVSTITILAMSIYVGYQAFLTKTWGLLAVIPFLFIFLFLILALVDIDLKYIVSILYSSSQTCLLLLLIYHPYLFPYYIVLLKRNASR